MVFPLRGTVREYVAPWSGSAPLNLIAMDAGTGVDGGADPDVQEMEFTV